MRFQWMLLGVLVFASACGGSRYQGTWEGTQSGTMNGQAFSQSTKVTFTQEGDNVTGTYSSGSGASLTSGTVKGTANGDKLDPFTATSAEGCAYTGTLTLADDTLKGTVTGNSSGCVTLTSTFDLKKQ